MSSFFLTLGLAFLLIGFLLALYKGFTRRHAAPPWVIDPTHVASFPPEFQAQVAEKWNQWEAQKNKFLQPIIDQRLPLPQEVTPFRAAAQHRAHLTEHMGTQYIFTDVVFTYPTYAVPPYLALPILVGVYYLICNPRASYEQITEEIKKYGVDYVVYQYPGAWVSGDPYIWFINPNPALLVISQVAPPHGLMKRLPERLKTYLSINPDRAQVLTTPPLFTKIPLPPDMEPFLSKDPDTETTIGFAQLQDRQYHSGYMQQLFTLPNFHELHFKPEFTDFVSLPDSVRDKHVYVVGKSGTGKSTLILNMARQDIERGEGICVIDPHGDLAEDLLTYIPEERIKDTIYINAADTKYPVSINVLSVESDEEIVLLADDLLVTFRRLSENSWGERMENILRHSFHTLLRYPGATFLDVQHLLQDPGYRSDVLAKVKDPTLTSFWKHSYSALAKDAAQPILNRMSKFSLSPPLAGILSHAESRLNFFDAIQKKRIIIVNLAKGKIGEDNSKLLGSLIVSQLQLAVMRRANLPKSARTPFYVYVDEFQNFTNSAFNTILSEARKYKLCLTLAHQFISQIDSDLKHAIFGNVGTMIVFPLAENDAAPLKHELGQYDHRSVADLEPRKHEALYRPASGARDTIKIQTLPPKPIVNDNTAAIIEYTRQHYSLNGTKRASQNGAGTKKEQTPPQEADEPAQERQQEQQRRRAQTEEQTPHESDASHTQTEFKYPADAPPLELSREDKLLHYLKQTSYLSTRQIIELCCTDLGSENSQKKAASKLTTGLEANGQLSSFLFEREKICYLGRKPNLRRHELGVRDIFVAIAQSGFLFTDVKFYHTLTQEEILNPDLSVSFVAEDGTEIPTFWEFDNGTEGDEVLLSKINRYQKYFRTHKIVFVFSEENRIQKLAKKLPSRLPIYYTTIALLGRAGGTKGGMGEAVFGSFGLPNLSARVCLFDSV